MAFNRQSTMRTLGPRNNHNQITTMIRRFADHVFGLCRQLGCDRTSLLDATQAAGPPSSASLGCGMRAMGGIAKPIRPSSSSRRICQMRPMKKPNTSAATISSIVTIDAVIDSSPTGQAATLTMQSYRTVLFWRVASGCGRRRSVGGQSRIFICSGPLLLKDWLPTKHTDI